MGFPNGQDSALLARRVARLPVRAHVLSTCAAALLLAGGARAQTVTAADQDDLAAAIAQANAGGNVQVDIQPYYNIIPVTGSLPALTGGMLVIGDAAQPTGVFSGGSLEIDAPLSFQNYGPNGFNSSTVGTSFSGIGNLTDANTSYLYPNNELVLTGTNSYSAGTIVEGVVGTGYAPIASFRNNLLVFVFSPSM